MPDNNQPNITIEQSNKPKPTDPKDIVTVDLQNPLRARRVIYDGILLANGTMKSIVIEPGQTKKGVRITKAIEQELRERKQGTDLVVTRSNDSQAA